MATSPLALLIACAQVTGLSDDYRYDLVDVDGGDASTNADDGAASPDVSASSDGGDRCTASDRTQAEATIGAAGGAELPLQCAACLAASCCEQIAACAAQAECAQSMECVFGCQRNGNKNQCVRGCKDAFSVMVGACVNASCAAPVCAL